MSNESENVNVKNRNNIVVICGLIMLMLVSITGCSGVKKSSAPDSQSPAVEVKMTDAEKAAFASYYVDAAWLKNNVNNVIILDARKPAEYQNNHIPGALNVTWQSLSNMTPKQGEIGWAVVLPPEKLAEKLGALGIDGSKIVVVYNNPNGLGEEGRVLWMLRMIGLDNTRILNGGWPAWAAGGGEVSKDNPQVTPVQLKTVKPDPALLATTEYIQLNKGKIKLLDTRSPEEYAGKDDHGEKQRGRIPGAIHLHYSDLYRADKTIKSIPELKELFQKAGLNPEDDIVVYCTAGIRSGFATEILRMSGYKNAKNYNASFSEWAGLGLPVEK
jgi:thiosulfate/3-mercaptopyruvate sulfurtransferase